MAVVAQTYADIPGVNSAIGALPAFVSERVSIYRRPFRSSVQFEELNLSIRFAAILEGHMNLESIGCAEETDDIPARIRDKDGEPSVVPTIRAAKGEFIGLKFFAADSIYCVAQRFQRVSRLYYAGEISEYILTRAKRKQQSEGD